MTARHRIRSVAHFKVHEEELKMTTTESKNIPLQFWLQAEGSEILRRTQEYLQTTNSDTLRTTTLLRKATSCLPQIASAALEITLCRQKAAAFGAWTEHGFFTRQSLEQATSPIIARHHAKNFAGRKHILEICTGAGFDTAALAREAGRVTTIEADDHLAAMARQNFTAQNITNVEILCGMAEAVCEKLDLTMFDGLWADPSRRTDQGKRIATPDNYAPSLAWLQHLPISGIRGIKIAPAVNCEPHHLTGDWRREWIGFDDECREQVLWSGRETKQLHDGAVTLLRNAAAAEHWIPQRNTRNTQIWSGDGAVLAGQFLIEPHGALIRTGHLASFFAERHWMLFAEQIAYGVAPTKPSESTFYQAFEILEAMPFHYARLRELITSYHWGSGTEIKKRGFPETPEEIRKHLKLPSGGDSGVLICTRRGDQHWAILARRCSSYVGS
jgi:hypothetical protein